jgi:hypothetical protein
LTPVDIDRSLIYELRSDCSDLENTRIIPLTPDRADTKSQLHNHSVCGRHGTETLKIRGNEPNGS